MACIRDISEMFASNRGFRGRAIEWRQTNSTATNPCCHGNEVWDQKIGYNLACIRDVSEMFASNRGFSWSGYWMTPYKFYHDQLRCHTPLPWQRNLRQNRLLLVLYKRYLRDACVYQGVLRERLSNDVNHILQRPTLVALATKIETKQTPPV